MRPTMRFLATAALAASGFFSLAAATGQAQSPPPGAGSGPGAAGRSTTTTPSANIPDQKLDAAAAAIDHITSLRQTYQDQLASATPSDRPRIASEANEALQKAVTAEGLSVNEYNSIVDAAQTDPQVREKLVQRLHPPAK